MSKIAKFALRAIFLTIMAGVCHQASAVAHTSPPHDYAADVTVVPDSLLYLRMEPIAYLVERPFPKVFLSDGSFKVNDYINETNIILTTADVLGLIEESRSLPCAGKLVGTDEAEYLLLTSRGQGGRLSKCPLRPADACDYLSSLQAGVIAARYDLSELRELARRMEC